VVFDECGNSDTVSQEVTVLPSPTLAPGPFQDCEPNVLLDAGAGYAAYFWPHSGETTQTVSVTTPGNYVVQVTDANGCVGTSDSIEAIIVAPPLVDAMPDSITIDDGALAPLTVVALGGGPVSFTWSPAGTLTCADCPSPFAFPGEPTTYLVYGTLFGCEGPPDSVRVLVEQVDLVLPNAFTPNGDGLNDNFGVTNPVRYPVFELRVFNRWGQEVFATSDISTRWDGTFQGKDQESAAYIWMIRYRKGRIDGEEVNLAGTVTLVR
jgi:gliding motility-associated-like protein